MEKAICPHCSKEIELEKIVKKFFGGKSKSTSLLNKIATGVMAPSNVAYSIMI